MGWVRNVVILAKVDCSGVRFAVMWVVTHWFHAQVGTALSHDCRIRTSKLTNVGDCKLVCLGRYPISRAERGGKYDSGCVRCAASGCLHSNARFADYFSRRMNHGFGIYRSHSNQRTFGAVFKNPSICCSMSTFGKCITDSQYRFRYQWRIRKCKTRFVVQMNFHHIFIVDKHGNFITFVKTTKISNDTFTKHFGCILSISFTHMNPIVCG